MGSELGKKIPEVVCVVLVSADNNVLLEERLDEDALHHKFTLPGGKVDPADSLQPFPRLVAAVKREIFEETALTPINPVIYTEFEEISENGFHAQYIGAYATRWEGEFENREANRRQLHWTPVERVGELIGENRVDSRIWQEYLKIATSLE